MTARVSVLLKSCASLTCFRAFFLRGRAKDLSALRYCGHTNSLAFKCSASLRFKSADMFPCVARWGVPEVLKNCDVSETSDITQRHSVTCQKISIFSIPLREPTIYHPRTWHQYVKDIVYRKWPQSLCNLRTNISFVCPISNTNNEGHLYVSVVSAASKGAHLYGNKCNSFVCVNIL